MQLFPAIPHQSDHSTLAICSERGNVNVLIQQSHHSGQPKSDLITIRHRLFSSPQVCAPVTGWFFQAGDPVVLRALAFLNVRHAPDYAILTRLARQRSVQVHVVEAGSIVFTLAIEAPPNARAVLTAAMDWSDVFVFERYDFGAARAAFCGRHSMDEIATW